MSSQALSELKASLRRSAAASAALSPASLLSSSAAAAAHVLSLPAWQAASTVALFLSLPSELSTEPLLEAAFAQGKRVLLPRVTGPAATDMTMLLAESLQEVLVWQPSRAHFGLRQPPLLLSSSSSSGSSSPRPDWRSLPTPGCIIVPGVLFDTGCGRLGHGKGYYDAFLCAAAARAVERGEAAPFLIGYALAEQLSEESLPMGPEDVFLDCIVTPAAALHRGQE